MTRLVNSRRAVYITNMQYFNYLVNCMWEIFLCRISLSSINSSRCSSRVVVKVVEVVVTVVKVVVVEVVEVVVVVTITKMQKSFLTLLSLFSNECLTYYFSVEGSVYTETKVGVIRYWWLP